MRSCGAARAVKAAAAGEAGRGQCGARVETRRGAAGAKMTRLLQFREERDVNATRSTVALRAVAKILELLGVSGLHVDAVTADQ
jgi:hypothetical protein